MYTVSRFREGKGRLSRLFFFFFFFILAANRGRRRADRTDRFFLSSSPPAPSDFCDAREFETSPTPPRENILVHGFSTDWSFFQIRRIFKIPYSFFVCLFRAGTKKKFSIRIKSVSRISFDVPHVRFILKTILYILSLSFSIERKETSMIYI